MSLAQQILLQIILIAINAFFAATEIAVVSLNTTKLKKMAEDGDKYAPKLLKMAENPTSFLSTIQIGITLAGFLGSAFAADNLAVYIRPLFEKIGLPTGVSGTISIIIITLIISFFTLIFGELVPKRVAQQKSFAVAKFSSGVISVTAKIMRPVVWLLTASTNLVLRICRIKDGQKDDSVTEDDIKLMVDAGGESGSIEEDEKEWIQNVFEFNDISVTEIMTREPDVVSFQVDTPSTEILDTIKDSGLSRFPVYGDDKNDILGILNARDFLINLNSGEHKSVEELLRPAYMVPDSIHADKLFSDMQEKKTHIAIVVDEYGQSVGIITLEDLLEEIVGNIYDEFDPQEEAEVRRTIDDGSFLEADAEREEVLAHQEDIRGIAEEYDHHAQIRIDQPEPCDCLVVRDEDDIARDHHGAHEEIEDELAAWEAVERERIASHGCGDDPYDARHACKYEGVEHEPHERCRGYREDVVVQYPVLREELRRHPHDLIRRHEGDEQRIDDGDYDDDSDCNRHRLIENIPGFLYGFLAVQL